MREVPNPHAALLSGHELSALGAAKIALDMRRHIVDIDDAFFLVKGTESSIWARKEDVPATSMLAASGDKPTVTRCPH